jgi:CheY-like chemotaxis protein
MKTQGERAVLFLDYCGATVMAVGSAREALDALHTMNPHVLVSDIGMPGEDRLSLLQRSRNHPHGKQIPPIASPGSMTSGAFAAETDRPRGVMRGGSSHRWTGGAHG